MTTHNEQDDAALIRGAWAATLSEANCPNVDHYLTEVLAAAPSYKRGRLAVVTESVPDPRGGERLAHRVVRVLSREGDVRHTGFHAPMTVRDLLAEMWVDRAMHRRVGWRPYGAPLTY